MKMPLGHFNSHPQQNIKTRKNAHELNSPALNDKYLKDMETLYKQQFLKEISEHAEILIYDWSSGGDTEVVVEDIERIDFNEFEKDYYNKKMKDWRIPLENMWTEQRIKYCNEMPDLMAQFNVPRYDVPELLRSADDGKVWRDVWFNVSLQIFPLW